MGLSKDGKTATFVWSTIDIIYRAKDRDITITEDQAKRILKNIASGEDDSTGLFWDTIDIFTDNLVSDV